MLTIKQQPKTLRLIIALLLLNLLASCSNSEALESFVNVDPQLRTEQNQENSDPDSSVNNSQNDPEVSSPPENQPKDSQSEKIEPFTTETNTVDSQPNYIANLPEELPEEIPLYPQAELQSVNPELTEESGSLTLRSQADLSAIANYYQSQLTTQEWEFLQPFSLDSDGNSQSVIAGKNNLKMKISLADVSVNNEDNGSQTEIKIAYKPYIPDLATLDPVDPQSVDSKSIDPESNSESKVASTSTEKPTVSDNPTPVTTTVKEFSDLTEAREQLQQSVKDVANLDILTPQTKDASDQFNPNELVTRRDYVRWLVSANNKYHDSSPGKKIHLAKNSPQKAFKDIDVNDPDFGAIQGLAEAGLIPSILTSDGDNVLFRPDATLTREDLVTWKVPLDVRGALSKASIETIEETWGFQDAAKISPQAMRALFNDYQNGDRANVRRIFGYTTLFQPKKGVTRAEAAASLWYFGYQGDGINAEELLDLSQNQ